MLDSWLAAPVGSGYSESSRAGGVGSPSIASSPNQPAQPAIGTASTGAQTQFNDWNSSAAPTYTAPTNEQNRFETGLSDAQSRMSSLLDDPSSIQQSAAYKFRLGQGEQALQRQQAAKGMLGSGNRLMELTKYGQDMASQEYDNQATRLSGLLNNYSTNWNQAQGANLQSAANIYGTNMQAHSQKGSTLASLLGSMYGSEQSAASSRYGSDRSVDAAKANPWSFASGAGAFNKDTGQIVSGGTGYTSGLRGW
jgi:hypothetical protein